jgi:hypothetical protein|tara:strand:- start:2622 stop:3014 length:393 start_codon:yes stop_codon:yes gene_type:complete
VSKKDWDELAKIEKAISKKYGKEAIQNPKANWSGEKEQEYLSQIKKLSKKETELYEKDEKVEVNGILVPRKLLNKESNRTCPVCDTYSFDVRDDVYMNKYDCCWECYIQWVEDREERWLSGWRPNNGNDT